MQNDISPRVILGLVLLVWLSGAAEIVAQEASQVKEIGSWEVTEAEKQFALVVLPALEAKCAACHGRDAETLEAEFVMTDLAGMMRGGESYDNVLVPGNHAASWLYRSASYEYDELQMPPKEADRLEASTLNALAEWIDAGAPWPSREKLTEIRRRFATGVAMTTSGGLDANWDERLYRPETLWAYQPLSRPEIPVKRADRRQEKAPGSVIDYFIDAKLDAAGIEPLPRADRRSLIRRLALDVHGVPPSPEAVQRFVSNPANEVEAWEQLVDEFLAAPRFGEQSTRHWLDGVRYADSSGFANDFVRPNAWRYRDYVVNQFNHDKGFDAFAMQQIAGDEMDAQDPENLIAVGMLRMGPWEHTAMSVAKITRQQFLDDVTDVVGQVFLAHPLQCARCHDHKFDPIPTRDYYRIQAVFATTQFTECKAAFSEAEQAAIDSQPGEYLQQRIGRFQELLAELAAKEKSAAQDWYAKRGLAYAPRAKKQKEGVPESKIAPKHVGFTPRDFGLERIGRKYLVRHRWELDQFRPVAFSVYTGVSQKAKSMNGRRKLPNDPTQGGVLEKTAILTGGDPFSPSQTVTPGVLSVLTGVMTAERSSIAVRGPAALAYAKRMKMVLPSQRNDARHSRNGWWIPKGTRLTPRVWVNRIWLQHFGKGIVTTPNNFGTNGRPPTHPALLDYLASELVDSNWSSKRIHRMILLSDAYCRASQGNAGQLARIREKDPEGSLCAAFQTRRLAAEEIRDSALAVSGLLDCRMGGPPVRTDLNPEVAIQPRQIMGTYAPIYQPSPRPQDRVRRTIYAEKLRGLRDPMLEVFNQPSPDLPCELRDSSTVAPQALTLLNGSSALIRAMAMAARICQELPEHDDRQLVQRAFQLAYGRSATNDELEACMSHWKKMANRHAKIEMASYRPPERFTRQFVDENTGEMFEYTEELEQNQDYHVTIELSQLDARTKGLGEVCLVLLSSNEFLYVP